MNFHIHAIRLHLPSIDWMVLIFISVQRFVVIVLSKTLFQYGVEIVNWRRKTIIEQSYEKKIVTLDLIHLRKSKVSLVFFSWTLLPSSINQSNGRFSINFIHKKNIQSNELERYLTNVSHGQRKYINGKYVKKERTKDWSKKKVENVGGRGK